MGARLRRFLQDPVNQAATIIAELALSPAAAFAFQFEAAERVATLARHRLFKR
jgi:hypothetical protein